MPAVLPFLELPATLRREMWAHAQAEAPRECVGVLGGQLQAGGGQAQVYLPLPNVAARPQVEYQADPAALLRALRAFRAGTLELCGIFHSHPQGPQTPSAADRAGAGYDVPYLIADLRGGTLRAFVLPGGDEVALLPASGLLPWRT